jgi:hypothetical protein
MTEIKKTFCPKRRKSKFRIQTLSIDSSNVLILELCLVQRKRGSFLTFKRATNKMVELPKAVKMVIAVGGIFVSFGYFALLQEDLFKKSYGGERFKSTFFMMVAERGVNALVALFFLLVTDPSNCHPFPPPIQI